MVLKILRPIFFDNEWRVYPLLCTFYWSMSLCPSLCGGIITSDCVVVSINIWLCLLRRREPYLYLHQLTSGCLSIIKEAQITRTSVFIWSLKAQIKPQLNHLIATFRQKLDSSDSYASTKFANTTYFCFDVNCPIPNLTDAD